MNATVEIKAGSTRYLASASIFSLLSMGVFWGWLIVQENTSTPSSLVGFILGFFVLPMVIGAILGTVIAYWARTWRAFTRFLTAIFCLGLVGVAGTYYLSEAAPVCRYDLKSAFHRQPDSVNLSSWCVDDRLLRDLLRTTVKKNDLENFERLIAAGASYRDPRGASYGDPNCPRLILNIANGNMEEIERLIDQGVKGDCYAYGRSPIQAFLATENIDSETRKKIDKLLLASVETTDETVSLLPEKQTERAIKRDRSLLDQAMSRGEPVYSQDLMLAAIRTGEHSYLSAAVKHVNPNFGGDAIAYQNPVDELRNPLALAIYMADARAFEILIKAGAELNPQTRMSIDRGKYTIHQYALKRASKARKDAAKHRDKTEYARRHKNLSAIVAWFKQREQIQTVQDRKLRVEEQNRKTVEETNKQQQRLEYDKKLIADRHAAQETAAIQALANKELVFPILNARAWKILTTEKPDTMRKIKVFNGRIWGFERKGASYKIHAQPDPQSQLLFSKPKNSLILENADGSEKCSFSLAEDKPGSCLNYLEAIHSHADGSRYFKTYLDYIASSDGKGSWFLVSLFGKPAWVQHIVPKNQENEGFSGAVHAVDHLLVNWPGIVQARENSKIYAGLDRLEQFERFNRQRLQLRIEDTTIHWIGERAFVQAGLTRMTSRLGFCTNGIPETIAKVYIELFDEKGDFNLGKHDFRGECMQ